MTLAPSQHRYRLLFLLPFAPRPDAAHGGSRAMAQLLLPLSLRHEIAILYLRADGDPEIHPVLRERCRLVEAVQRPSGLASLFRPERLASLARFRPLWPTFTAVRELGVRLQSTAASFNPDLVQVECQVMAQYLSALPGWRVPCVLTVHEPGAAAARDRVVQARGLSRLGHRLSARAWARYERDVLRHPSAVVVLTERDRASLEELATARRVVTIPLGAAIPERACDPFGTWPPAILFAGSFRHAPNVEAAMRLGASIFPRVRDRCAEARLLLVGERPPSRLRALAGEGVVVTGRVADVAPFLESAAVVVAPIRSGGGMRVKVLEALAAGKAIVASPRAAEGLPVVHDEQIVLAETDEEFAAAIVELLEDAGRRRRLATAARAWAVSHLDGDRSVTAFEALYRSLIAGGEGARLPDRRDWRSAHSRARSARAATPTRDHTGARPTEAR